MSASPESAEDYYARVAAAADDEGRLPVAVEEMPGWDIFPFEIDSLQIKPLQPLSDAEPTRGGEQPGRLLVRPGPRPAVRRADRLEQRALAAPPQPSMRLPIAVNLIPRAHHDLPDLPEELAGEMGRLLVAVARAIEALPSVGRAQVAKYGDGGAHLHAFLFGRPARMLQLRGSPLLDWEENLPSVPLEVLRANASTRSSRIARRVARRRRSRLALSLQAGVRTPVGVAGLYRSRASRPAHRKTRRAAWINSGNGPRHRVLGGHRLSEPILAPGPRGEVPCRWAPPTAPRPRRCVTYTPVSTRRPRCVSRLGTDPQAACTTSRTTAGSSLCTDSPAEFAV